MNQRSLPQRVIILVGATGIALLCWYQSAQTADTCVTLLNDRCQQCHYLTRVCDKVADNKGKWSWKRTVSNMVRQGAKLDETEQDRLVRCLSDPAPEVSKLCAQNK